jgi:ribosomal protein L3 glutamine methyltransferase
MNNKLDIVNARTAGDLIQTIGKSLSAADLYYGHGTENPLDEAAALVFHVMSLDHSGTAELYNREATDAEHARIVSLVEQRIQTRSPLPYLLGEAWFAGLPFNVDERVLIPRSPIAELVADNFQPWVEPESVCNILEIGTGSGCIAIACALAFPGAQVTATDISAAALEVAAGNARRHGVEDRVQLIETDHVDGIAGGFDLIVSNPPYVPQGEMDMLPPEFKIEPSLGLVSGVDGLDSARRILQDAPKLMNQQGIMVLEVGAQCELLDRAFPHLAFTWLEFEYGGIGVALLREEDFVTNVSGDAPTNDRA